MKTSFIIRLLVILILVSWSFGVISANKIKVGNAEIRLNIHCADSLQLPPSLNGVILASSLFENAFEYDYHNLQRTGNGFVGNIPLDTETAEVGIILRDSIQAYLMGIITLSQNFPTVIDCSFKSDSLTWNGVNPKIRFNKYSFHPREMNSSMLAAEVIMKAANYHLATTEIEPDFAEVYDSEGIMQKMVELKNVIHDYSFNDIQLPQEIEYWVDNILEYDFASQWLMHIERIIPGFELTIPSEGYDFLNVVDKDKIYYDRIYYLGPYSFFKSLLTNYHEKISRIGDDEVSEWKIKLREMLKRNIENPSDEFLNMLAVTSYKMQIDDSRPLSTQQLINIENGLPPDYAIIINSFNTKLVAALNKDTNLQDFLGCQFSLAEYLEDSMMKHFVCIDLWNTWCMPCTQEIREREYYDYAAQFPDVEFISICDESSDIDMWKSQSAMIKGPSIIIDTESMYQIFGDYGIHPCFPTHLLLNNKGKIVKVSTGFMTNKEFQSFLKESIK